MKRRISSQIANINIIERCFPFSYDESNKIYLCKCHNGDDQFKTSKAQQAFRHSQMFIIKYLEYNENAASMFEQMIDDALKNEEFMKEFQNEKEEMENQQQQMEVEINENVIEINDEQRMEITTNENNQETENINNINNNQIQYEFTNIENDITTISNNHQ